MKNCLIASAQRMGCLPIIFETENNFDFNFAMACGMRATPIYGDVEVNDVDPQTRRSCRNTYRTASNRP